MSIFTSISDFIYNFLWSDLFTVPLPNGSSLGICLLVLILIPLGIYFTIRTKFLPIRFFPEMLRISIEKKSPDKKNTVSGLQSLIVSTATRVGMGNMVGVVSAISLGGAGAIFWMWITALIGTSTAFIEATLAQLHKKKDPLYGGTKGGPAYYIHNFYAGKKRFSIIAVLFAISALICFSGISQVIGNSISSSFENAFKIPPIVTTVILVAMSAVIILRKNATVKVLDILVPIMAGFYLLIAVYIMVRNYHLLPGVFKRIITEAFGIRQIVAGGLGAVLTQGVQRGLFSNEAGSGSAPCAAATADVSHPAKAGLFQAFGVIIDTIVICTCTAMIVLLTPEGTISGLKDIGLLQEAMRHHFGYAGVVFTAATVWAFSFSTFIGLQYYARSNVSYLFGDKWEWQNAFKVLSLIMLFMGGIFTFKSIWTLGDIGIGLMTVFNTFALIPMGGQAIRSLKDYNQLMKSRKNIK